MPNSVSFMTEAPEDTVMSSDDCCVPSDGDTCIAASRIACGTLTAGSVGMCIAACALPASVAKFPLCIAGSVIGSVSGLVLACFYGEHCA